MTQENAPTGDDRGWFVSSFSSGSASCVEVKFAGQGIILVRDSKDGRAASPVVRMPSRGWASLLTDISSPA